MLQDVLVSFGYKKKKTQDKEPDCLLQKPFSNGTVEDITSSAL